MVHLPFRPYDSLFRHEGYKILIAGRGLLILLIFLSLCGVHDLEKKYEPSPGEQYYQELMLSLEGRLTGKKKIKFWRNRRAMRKRSRKLPESIGWWRREASAKPAETL